MRLSGADRKRPLTGGALVLLVSGALWFCGYDRRQVWRGAPVIQGALCWFCLLLFDILVSEEICGRFGLYRPETSVCRATRGASSDDVVSASLFERALSSLEAMCIRQMTPSRFIFDDGLGMCRGSNVKDTPATAFQLESLILAQNERWRQA